jgi:uncharacterized membrane protein YfcA
MAYGVSATTVLFSIGIPPAIASASVHSAEIFTTLASGLSHLRLGNVDKKLFKRLLIPGMMGGALGAYVLVSLSGKVIKPFVSLYLFIMGLMILRRALKKIKEVEVKTKIVPLGIVGGFFDAIGGGGWGPIVTSTLMARGHNPVFTIGSVNLAEFFVTVVEAGIFFALLGLSHWRIIVGLIIGGVLAAPLSAYVCKKIPPRILMLIVGVVIIVLSLRILYLTLG